MTQVDGQYQIVASADVAEVQPGPRRSATVKLSSGETWDVRKDGGCGCSDPLKSMNMRRFLETA